MELFPKDVAYPRGDIRGFGSQELVDHIAHQSLRMQETETQLLRLQRSYVDMTERAYRHEEEVGKLTNRLAIRDKEVDALRQLNTDLQDQLRGKIHKADDDRLRARRERDAARRAAKKP